MSKNFLQSSVADTIREIHRRAWSWNQITRDRTFWKFTEKGVWNVTGTVRVDVTVDMILEFGKVIVSSTDWHTPLVVHSEHVDALSAITDISPGGIAASHADNTAKATELGTDRFDYGFQLTIRLDK